MPIFAGIIVMTQRKFLLYLLDVELDWPWQKPLPQKPLSASTTSREWFWKVLLVLSVSNTHYSTGGYPDRKVKGSSSVHGVRSRTVSKDLTFSARLCWLWWRLQCRSRNSAVLTLFAQIKWMHWMMGLSMNTAKMHSLCWPKAGEDFGKSVEIGCPCWHSTFTSLMLKSNGQGWWLFLQAWFPRMNESLSRKNDFSSLPLSAVCWCSLWS